MDTCDTAALVISELVTNAIVHTASSRVVCELHDHDDTVRIAVHDEGCAPGQPRPAAQRPEEEQGRGLLLVDALCESWGAQERGPGLLVWAELARQTDAVRGTAEPRNDLGWGARPKPAPSHGGSGEDERAERAKARQEGPWEQRGEQHGDTWARRGEQYEVPRERHEQHEDRMGPWEQHGGWGRP